jgi:hypothetical protein
MLGRVPMQYADVQLRRPDMLCVGPKTHSIVGRRHVDPVPAPTRMLNINWTSFEGNERS